MAIFNFPFSKSFKKSSSQKHKKQQQRSQVQEWGELVPFSDTLLPVDVFQYDMLPEPLSAYVKSHAERLDKAPEEYAAVALLTCAAGVIGNSASIQPKKNDTTWKLHPVLWGILIGSPSRMKTPSCSAGTSLLRYVQEYVFKPNNEAREEEFNVTASVNRLVEEELQTEAKKAFKAGDSDKAQVLYRNIEELSQDEPLHRDILISDFTTAALEKRLRNNPNGLMMYTDEYAKFLNSLNDRSGDEKRAFVLTCYDACGDYVSERVNRGKTALHDPNMSMLGGIQPSMFRTLVSDRKNGKVDDGMFERLQLMVMPDYNGEYTDEAPDMEAIHNAENVFVLLAKYSESQLDAKSESQIYRFTPEAQQCWTDWATSFKQHTMQQEEHVQSTLTKYPGFCARLALVLHFLSEASSDGGDGEFQPSLEIPLVTLEMAIKWLRLFQSHNRRIEHYYENDHSKSEVQLLLSKLPSLVQPFSARDIYHGRKDSLRNAETVKLALDELSRRNYIRAVERLPGDKKTTPRYEINPKLVS